MHTGSSGKVSYKYLKGATVHTDSSGKFLISIWMGPLCILTQLAKFLRYLGYAYFEYWLEQTACFPRFAQSLHENSGIVPQIRSLLLPSTSCTIHHSLVILLFSLIYSASINLMGTEKITGSNYWNYNQLFYYCHWIELTVKVYTNNKHTDQAKESCKCNWNLIYGGNIITKQALTELDPGLNGSWEKTKDNITSITNKKWIISAHQHKCETCDFWELIPWSSILHHKLSHTAP
jgi:hypothetical protein